MTIYRRVYDSRHLQADCQEPGSVPEPYARQSSMGYLYLNLIYDKCRLTEKEFPPIHPTKQGFRMYSPGMWETKYEGFRIHSSQIYQNGNKSIYYVHKVDVQRKLMPYVAGYGPGLWARSDLPLIAKKKPRLGAKREIQGRD